MDTVRLYAQEFQCHDTVFSVFFPQKPQQTVTCSDFQEWLFAHMEDA